MWLDLASHLAFIALAVTVSFVVGFFSGASSVKNSNECKHTWEKWQLDKAQSDNRGSHVFMQSRVCSCCGLREFKKTSR